MSAYRFHRCQTYPALPNLQGWYLELRPDDADTLIKVHRGVVHLYFAKFGQDPHMAKLAVCSACGAPTQESFLYNPIRLAATWLLGVEKYLLAGKSVLVNVNGGIMPFDGAIILETTESDVLSWDVRYDDERITISRWPKGHHYYLSSNKSRMFVPEKYASYADAHANALRYVTPDRIQSQC
jgi:hypothetical protein